MKTAVLTALLLLLAPATADAKPTPRICATIDNIANAATWSVNGGPTLTARYRDQGGPRLVFDRPVPRAVRLAEAKLQHGAPGPKVRKACTGPVRKEA